MSQWSERGSSPTGKIRYLTQGAMIAALYVLLTWISAQFGLASGAIQVRLSEALAILPVFYAPAVPGLILGCFLANVVTGGLPLDWVFGTLATGAGAVLCRLFFRKGKAIWLASIPNIVCNTLVIPWVLLLVYKVDDMSVGILHLTVGAGEVTSCGILGTALLWIILKRRKRVQEIREKQDSLEKQDTTEE